MASSPKGSLTQRLSGLKDRLRHAFALGPEGAPLSAEDAVLLERVADAVVKRGLAAPAMVFLESVGPMNFLGSQALHFFTPLLEVAFPQREVERIARLLERRDTLPKLTALIESRTQPDRAGRRV
jgi:hypothetical protein